MAFSLVPHFLHSYGLQEETLWRASSGLYVIVSMIVGASLVPRIRRIRALQSNVRSEGREGLVANPIFFLEAILSLLNVLGVTRQLAAAIYLTVLASRMFLSGLAFSLVIFSFLTPSESDE